MARVRFIADFDYRPTQAIVIAYLAGMEETVKRDCANKAIAAGKAVELPQFSRGSHGTDHTKLGDARNRAERKRQAQPPA